MLLMLGAVSGEVETFTSSPEDCDPAEILGIIDRALDTALNRSSERLNATEASLVPEQAFSQKDISLNTTGDFFNLFSSNHTLSVLYEILRQDLASANSTNESASVQSDEQSASSIRPALLVDNDDELVTFPPNNVNEVENGESKCKFYIIISLIKYYF